MAKDDLETSVSLPKPIADEIVTVLELALCALNDKSILEKLDLSDEYANELGNLLANYQGEFIEQDETED